MRFSDFAKSARAVMIPAVGGALAIGLMEFLGGLADLPLRSLPFVTSIVLVMAAPQIPAARPRAIFLGHILSTVAGFAALWTMGPSPTAAAVAVGLSILLMKSAGALHPPASINAFVVVTEALGIRYLFVPVAAGAVILVAWAFVYHRMTLDPRWPYTRADDAERAPPGGGPGI